VHFLLSCQPRKRGGEEGKLSNGKNLLCRCGLRGRRGTCFEGEGRRSVLSRREKRAMFFVNEERKKALRRAVELTHQLKEGETSFAAGKRGGEKKHGDLDLRELSPEGDIMLRHCRRQNYRPENT